MKHLLLLLIATSCTPLTPTPPFHFMETARVLPRGGASVGGAIGAGNFKDIGGGVGLAARARLGVGSSSEIGFDGALVARINDDEPTAQRPWLGKSTASLGKVTWKIAAAPWLAASA